MKNPARFALYLVVPLAVIASVVVSSPALMPGAVNLPHTFAAGTPAVASEVNDNFRALADAVDLNADLIDVLSMDAVRRPANTITVAKSNGDFTSVADALESIQDSSATNPYLVLVFPGIYVEDRSSVVPPFVELAGSGRDSTVIQGAISTGPLLPESAVLVLGEGATVRDLGVVNTAFVLGSRVGIFADAALGEAFVRNVKVRVIGANGSQNIGVFALDSILRMESCDIGALNGGSKNEACGLINSNLAASKISSISNSQLDAKGGVVSFGFDAIDASVDIRDSELSGASVGLRMNFSGVATVRNCTVKGSNVMSQFQTASVLAMTTRFIGINPQGDPNQFTYVHCVKADFSPIIDGKGSSVQ